MIYVVDPVCSGGEHQPFNAAFLINCRVAYPKSLIYFLAEKGHISSIQGSVAALREVMFVPIRIAGRHTGIVRRFISDFNTYYKVRRMIGHNKRSKVIFLSTTPQLLWIWRIFPPPNNARWLGIMHGGLAEIRHKPRFNIFRKVFSLRTALNISHPKIRFAVLEKHIYDKLTQMMPSLKDRVDLYEHPLPPDLIGKERRHAKIVGKEIRLGLLGLCTPQKGLLRFLALAKHFSASGFRFDIVGRIHEDFQKTVEADLRYLCKKPSMLPLGRAEFTHCVSELHYAAFFFSGGHYSLTASGVLLDCIALGIPIVGFRHPLFEQLEVSVGEIGYFCLPGDEVILLEELRENVSQTQYDRQCANIIGLRDSRNPFNMSDQIRSLLGD